MMSLCSRRAARRAPGTAGRRGGTRPGMTLMEVMIATAVISIGVLGMIASFNYINRGMQSAKGRSLANNLAQEKVEVLKNESYYRVLVTTATASDTNFDTPYTYDDYPNGSETLNVGGMNFTRRVWIRKVNESPSGALQYFNWNDPDTGLKEVLVYVTWFAGGEWKKVELRNLVMNPDRLNMTASFYGTVEDDSSDPIEGAIVRVQENPSRYAETDVDGNYSITLETGTYTMLATKTGYFSSVSPGYTVDDASPDQEHDFELPMMSSGTIYGYVYKQPDHLVISNVVGATVTATGHTEWVEVYNPTTWTWTMSTGLGTGNEKIILRYKETSTPENPLDFDYRTTTLAPDHYYLFANTGTVTAGGVTRAADAMWSWNGAWSDQDDTIKTGTVGVGPSKGGFVQLLDDSTGDVYDTLGWNAYNQPWPDYYPDEKEYFGMYYLVHASTWPRNYMGLMEDMSFTRYTGSSYVLDPSSASCHDSNRNYVDFKTSTPIAVGPRNTSDSAPCGQGFPAEGAVVFVDDGLSPVDVASSNGYFYIRPVSTGSWTVYMSSGVVYSSVAYYGGTTNNYYDWVGYQYISSPTAYGYVKGRVTDVDGFSLSDIRVAAGDKEVLTDFSGRYTLPAEPGEQTVYANHQTYDPTYIETSSIGVIVPLGEVASGDVDFTLLQGGKLSGWVTTNGTDPLPNIPVSAYDGGLEMGNGISDTDGYFTIWGSGISAGTYDVIPQLDSGESYSLEASTAPYPVVLGAGVDLFVGTYTVSGAMGEITGDVTLNGEDMTTGVLIYATSGTITGSPVMPPEINSTLRSGSVDYYAVSSDAQGHYELPVRGGYDYNVYAWYTSWSGDAPSTDVKTSTTAVTAGASSTVNFSW